MGKKAELQAPPGVKNGVLFQSSSSPMREKVFRGGFVWLFRKGSPRFMEVVGLSSIRGAALLVQFGGFAMPMVSMTRAIVRLEVKMLDISSGAVLVADPLFFMLRYDGCWSWRWPPSPWWSVVCLVGVQRSSACSGCRCAPVMLRPELWEGHGLQLRPPRFTGVIASAFRMKFVSQAGHVRVDRGDLCLLRRVFIRPWVELVRLVAPCRCLLLRNGFGWVKVVCQGCTFSGAGNLVSVCWRRRFTGFSGSGCLYSSDCDVGFPPAVYGTVCIWACFHARVCRVLVCCRSAAEGSLWACAVAGCGLSRAAGFSEDFVGLDVTAVRSGMLTGFHVLIYGRDWGRMGLGWILRNRYYNKLDLVSIALRETAFSASSKRGILSAENLTNPFHMSRVWKREPLLIIRAPLLLVVLGTTKWAFSIRLTKPMMLSWSFRMISHTGTETRPGLPRGAAVGNLGQWAKARSSNIA
ncbi:hypothetical protein HYC85_013259 [Camellia sinensis]|nr:hypothetical protein HYC85_013259 [Camellia sinensis]